MLLISAVLSFVLALLLKFVHFKREVTMVELLAGASLAALVSVFIQLAAVEIYKNQVGADYELWHSYVSNKGSVTKDCPSGWTSYPSSFCSNYDTEVREENCRTTYDSKGKATGRTCDYVTYYLYDYSDETRWYVKSPIATYEINRVDRRGTAKPPRFALIQLGDPVSITSSYQNWLLAPNNAFEYAPHEVYEAPAYPKVADYYNVNLVLGSAGDVTSEWNDTIRDWLRENGHEKQVSIIAHVTTNPLEYFDSVMYAWKGGKKNEVALFFGVDDIGNLKWFKSTSFAKGYGNQLLHGLLLDNYILQYGKKPDIESALEIVGENYVRYEMKNMEYIKDSIEVPTGVNIASILLSLAFAAGIITLLAKNDIRDRK